jgi:hypothetical protein
MPAARGAAPGRRAPRLAEIAPPDVKAFIRWLIEQEHPRKPGQLLRKATVREHAAVLRALMGDAMLDDSARAKAPGPARGHGASS